MNRLALRLPSISNRTAQVVSSRSATSVLSPLEQKYFPHIGNRELVGFGRNGTPMYLDDINCPYPPMRFQNHSDTIGALRKKEEGPWSNLSVDEVKALYRYSFCQTLAEATAPHGLWKLGFGWGFLTIAMSCMVFMLIRHVVINPPKNVTELPEYKEAIKYKTVLSRDGGIHDVLAFDVKTRRAPE